MIALAPEGFVETGRPYVREHRIFLPYRFSCNGERYQVELPVIIVNPDPRAVTRTKPWFDSDSEVG